MRKSHGTQNLKYLPLGFFTEKNCQPLLYNFLWSPWQPSPWLHWLVERQGTLTLPRNGSTEVSMLASHSVWPAWGCWAGLVQQSNLYRGKLARGEISRPLPLAASFLQAWMPYWVVKVLPFKVCFGFYQWEVGKRGSQTYILRLFLWSSPL